jgi:ABC-2 type transport system ATP-binding protein
MRLSPWEAPLYFRNMKAVSVRELCKGYRVREKGFFFPTYRDVPALAGVTFDIEPGERVAFLGPNGAGKSTTIKILSGILHPTSGEATVLGEIPWKARGVIAYQIGTVFGQRSQLWYHLPASDTFDLLARVYDLSSADYRERRRQLVERFDAGALLAKPVRSLSLGERMRLEIIASLLHRPRILFLDEPTIGLDVTAKTIIRELVREASVSEGVTILLTSHDTGDVERVCDRVLVINHGRLLLNQALATLRSRYIKKKVLTLLTVEPSVTLSLPGTTMVEASPHRLCLEIDADVTSVEEVIQHAMRATRLKDITVEDPPMEEIIKHIYREGP